MDDMFVMMKNVLVVEDFLLMFNSCYLFINFIMELVFDNRLLFIGMEVFKKGCKLEISVYCKLINIGLLFYY